MALFARDRGLRAATENAAARNRSAETFGRPGPWSGLVCAGQHSFYGRDTFGVLLPCSILNLLVHSTPQVDVVADAVGPETHRDDGFNSGGAGNLTERSVIHSPVQLMLMLSLLVVLLVPLLHSTENISSLSVALHLLRRDFTPKTVFVHRV